MLTFVLFYDIIVKILVVQGSDSMVTKFFTILSGLNSGISLAEKLANIGNAIQILFCNKSKIDYILLNTSKEVTVYKNGHGIVSYVFKIYVVNPAEFTGFYRKLNIDDGCFDSNFPLLSDMLNSDINQRGKNFGFWYTCTGNCISNVEEYYWSDTDYNVVDEKSKANPKEIRWRFNINTTALQQKGIYDISYSISIPGLFPIKDGKFDSQLISYKSDSMSSSLEVTHYMKSLTYTVSFDKSIEFLDYPKGKLYRHRDNLKPDSRNLVSETPTNVFYNKFVFHINNPKFSNNIVIKWKIK